MCTPESEHLSMFPCPSQGTTWNWPIWNKQNRQCRQRAKGQDTSIYVLHEFSRDPSKLQVFNASCSGRYSAVLLPSYNIRVLTIVTISRCSSSPESLAGSAFDPVSHQHSTTPAIVGVPGGIILLIVMIIIFATILRRHRRRAQHHHVAFCSTYPELMEKLGDYGASADIEQRPFVSDIYTRNTSHVRSPISPSRCSVSYAVSLQYICYQSQALSTPSQAEMTRLRPLAALVHWVAQVRRTLLKSVLRDLSESAASESGLNIWDVQVNLLL